MALSTSKAEQAAKVRDERAQEFGPGLDYDGRTSPGFVRAVAPSGDLVTFVPGEALPDWAATALGEPGSVRWDADAGVWVLGVGQPVAAASDVEQAIAALEAERAGLDGKAGKQKRIEAIDEQIAALRAG